MRSRFDEQLELLNAEMIHMGAMCEEVIALAASARPLRPCARRVSRPAGRATGGGSPQPRLFPALPPTPGRHAPAAAGALGRLRRPGVWGCRSGCHAAAGRLVAAGGLLPLPPPVPRPRWGSGEAEA